MFLDDNINEVVVFLFLCIYMYFIYLFFLTKCLILL